MKKNSIKKSFLSTLLTLLVVFSLLIAGPASAISIDITGSLTENSQGNIDIKVNLDESNDFIPDNANFTLLIDGVDCTFQLKNLLNGQNVTCANGAVITLDSTLIYDNQTNGYGYGYGYDGFILTYFSSNIVGYGYSYGYGYGYSAISNNVIDLNVAYTPSSAGDLVVELRVYATSDKYFTSKPKTITVTAATVTPEENNNNRRSTRSTVTPAGTQTQVTYKGSEANQYIKGLGLSNVEEVRAKLMKNVIENRGLEVALENVPESVKAKIQAIIDRDGKPESLTKSVELLNIKANGVWKTYTRVSISLEGISGTVEIVEIIPKEFAATADLLDSNLDFEVLEMDPIIKWTVSEGKADTIEYWAEGSKASYVTETYAVSFAKEVTPTNAVVETIAQDSINTGADKTVSDVVKKASLAWLWGVLIALVVIALVVFFVVRKKE